MNHEKLDCIAFPFQEEIFEDDEELRFGITNEGPFSHQLQLYPNSSVAIRHSEHTPLLGWYPNGGFSLTRWFETSADGAESLSHFHVDIYPRFEKKTENFINDCLRMSRGDKRIEKARGLRDLLPVIQICQSNALSLVSNHERFFSFKKGAFNVERGKIDAMKITYLDRSRNHPILRFGVETGEIIDDRTEEEYNILTIGAIYNFDPESIGTMLLFPVKAGTLTQAKLSEIARLQVSFNKK